MMTNATRITIFAAIGLLSFWGGLEVQKSLYEDQCLDLGGGRHPGQYPICVIERQSPALSLGPIQITKSDVVELQLGRTTDGQWQVALELTSEIANSLAAFTTESTGQNLDIRIGGQLANSVHIVDAIHGPNLILALSEPQAKELEKRLSLSNR